MRPLFLSALLLSCAPAIPLDGAPCPCAEGWVCCPGVGLCATDLARCESMPGPAVTPASAEVGLHRRLEFHSPDADVTWAVEEADAGGHVEADGTYTAPDAPGTFHVIARSAAGATRVTVVVRPLRLASLAGQYGGPATRPLDGVGSDARVASPSSGVIVGGAFYFLDLIDALSPTDVHGPVLRRLDLGTQRVETLASSGGAGAVDGPLAQAQFESMQSLAATGANELLVTDEKCIRRVDVASQVVSTVTCPDAGTGVGSLTAAWVGDETSLYFVRNQEHAVYRFDRATGSESILAGRPDTAGFDDGDAGLLDTPSGLALGQNGLYVVDQLQSALRRVELDGGEVRTLVRLDGGVDRFAAVAAGLDVGLGEAVGVTSLGALFVPPATAGSAKTGGQATSLAIEPNGHTALICGADGVYRHDFSTDIDQLVAGRARPLPGQRDAPGTAAGFVFDSSTAIASERDAVWLAEGAARTLRRVTRDGQPATVFRDVRPDSFAVTTDFVYAVVDGTVRRAPVGGGAWQTLATAVTAPVLLGALDDGRVLLRSSLGVGFIDPVSFSAQAPFWPKGAELGWPLALDPAGALFFVDSAGALARLDVDGGAVTVVGMPWDTGKVGVDARYVARDGRLYASVFVTALDESSTRVFELEPATGTWRALLGDPLVGAVREGPLDAALLHQVVGLAVLANGDLVIADGAEDALLVVE